MSIKKHYLVTIILSLLILTIGVFSYLLVIPSSVSNFQVTVCISGCDTNDIREAVNRIPDSGGTINIGPGTYNIDHSILIDKDNVKIYGAGRETKIINSYEEIPEHNEGQRDIFTVEAKNIEIKNMYFQTAGWLIGNSVNVWKGSENVLLENLFIRYGVDCLSVENSAKVTINNVYGRECEHGLGITNSHNIRVYNVDFAGTEDQLMQRGIGIWDSYGVKIDVARIDVVTATGIFINTEDDDAGFATHDIEVNNFVVQDSLRTVQRGIFLNARGSKNIKNIKFSNITLNTFGDSIGDGVSVDAEDVTVIEDVTVENLNVYAARNPFAATARKGILKNWDLKNLYLYSHEERPGAFSLGKLEVASIDGVVSRAAGGSKYTALNIGESADIEITNSFFQGDQSSDLNIKNSTDINYLMNGNTFVNQDITID